MDLELISMTFLVILGLISLFLIIYAVYLILRNLPKFLKAQKISQASYKEEILYYSENKEVKKFFIVIVTGIYCMVLFQLLSGYFFPDAALRLDSTELTPYNSIIGLILLLFAYSMVPTYFAIKMALKETLLEKVPFPVVLMLPTTFPLFSSWAYDLTGTLFYSFILFCSGVLFNLLAFKYRNLNDKITTTDVDLDTERMVLGLSAYITEFEQFRPPIPFVVSPYTFKRIFKLASKQRDRFYFVRNSDLNRKTRRIMDGYFQDRVKSMRDSLFVFLTTILTFLIVLGCVLLFKIYLNLSEVHSMFLTLIIGILTVYPVLAWKVNKVRTLNGKKHENDIKNAVQMLIDHGKGCIEENGLNPTEFPIILRHNDYDGLEYEIKGFHDYIGFFKLDPTDFIDEDELYNVHLNDDGEKLKSDEKEQGYLICEECYGYYKLLEDESPEDFAECECGGKLKHYRDIDKIFEEN